MEDDPGAAEDERTVELSSIAAIYPEMTLDPSDPYAAVIEVPVTPEHPLKIHFQASADGAPPNVLTPPTSAKSDGQETENEVTIGTAAAVQKDLYELAHLPPISVKIVLPEGYPRTSAPCVTLSSLPRWLPKSVLHKLRNDCTTLWEEVGRDQVVFAYIDQVQTAAGDAFGIGRDAGHEFQLPSDLKLALLDYDLKTRRECFENETFECGMCLEPKKGAVCHRLLLCGHVTCVSCLQDFYNSCITEGDVDNVKCVSPGCGKDVTASAPDGKRRKIDRTLNPSELLQIPIDQEQVQRYVRLKRKKKLEADKSIVYCPRQWCQGAARSKKHPKPTDLLHDVEESGSEADTAHTRPKKKKTNPEDIPMSERLCICEDCNFAFCSVCKKGWHGELSVCNPRRQAELNEEEKASLAYLQRYSTACPTCNAPSQKTHGCNHMICFKCKTHFCYLCSAYLMPDNPFRHFNEFQSNCYMRLWELEGGDGVDAGPGFAGGDGQVADWEAEHVESDSDTDSELSEEDFADFAGDGLINLVADAADNVDVDSDDSEPAPDQRRAARNMHVEIVNFAGNGGNRRIELPERTRGVNTAGPPPAAARQRPQPANPPRRDRGQRQRAPNRLPQFDVRAAQPERRDQEIPLRPTAAPGQGARANHLPAPFRAMGLERFLQLAQNDQEDEWDSDELDE